MTGGSPESPGRLSRGQKAKRVNRVGPGWTEFRVSRARRVSTAGPELRENPEKWEIRGCRVYQEDLEVLAYLETKVSQVGTEFPE